MSARVPKRVRADAALACMAVAAVRHARAAWSSLRREYGLRLANIQLDEIVDAAAAELAQRAREDYAVAASHAAVFIPDYHQDDDVIEEERARHEARIDGLRWSEAAALLLDGWTP